MPTYRCQACPNTDDEPMERCTLCHRTLCWGCVGSTSCSTAADKRHVFDATPPADEAA